MTAASRLADLGEKVGIAVGEDRFLEPVDEHTRFNLTSQPGVFLAGASKGPLTISNTIADAGEAALQIHEYLKTL